MSKGMSLAAGGVVLVAVVAGALLLANDDSEVGGSGATVSTSSPGHDAPPAFENTHAPSGLETGQTESSTPLAVANSPAAVAPSQTKAAAAPHVGPSVTLTGRVVDENGRPVPEARVTFVSDPLGSMTFGGGRFGASLPAETLPQVRTGRDGRFSLTGTLPPPEDKPEGVPLPELGPQLVVQQDVFASLVHSFEKLAAPGADVGDLQLAAGAWITGRVVDEVGRPLAGAHVRARGQSDGRRSRGLLPFFGGAEALDEFVTGTDGRFRVNGLPAGKADLTVTAKGRRLSELQDLELVALQPKDVGDVALAQGQSIAGVVLDSEGKGVAGASVSVSSMARLVVNRIEDLPRGQIGQEFGQRSVTGADGSFEISGLGGGQYTVHVSADGFDRLSKEDIPAGTRDLRLVPIRLGGLFVRLVSQGDGKPVPDTRLRATAVQESSGFMRREDASLAVLSGQAALDAAGRTGDPVGAWFVPHAGLRGTKLVVAADGFATKEVDGPPVDSRAIGEISVQLVPESVVAGRVQHADGTPVHGADVTLAAPRPEDEDGGWSGPGVGRRFSRTMRIGSMADEAEPIDAGRLTTQTMADGSFELRGAAPGAWELSAKHEDHVDSTPQPLTLAAGEQQRDLVVTLAPAGVIVGTVVEADGTPAADVEVTASSAAARAPSDGNQDITATIGRMLSIEDGTGRRFARTTSDGSYRISGLAEGEYDVTLGRGNRRGRTMGGGGMVFAFGGPGEASSQPPQVVQVTAGAEVRADFVRARRGTITGRVIAGGRPVPDQPVTMRRKSEGDFRLPFGGEEARTDERGQYSFTDVEAGEYDLSTHVPRSALEREVSVKLEAGDSRTADIVFGGSTLSGKVVDKDHDSGAGGVNVTLVPVKDEPAAAGGVQMSFAFVTMDAGPGGGGGGMTMELGNGPAQQIRTDPEGHFELLWVEPGKYRLEASGGGYVKGEAEAFEVADGQNKDDLLVKVARGAIVQGTVVSGQTGEQLDAVPVRIEGDDSRQMTVTQKGRFSFEGLSAGTYTVTVLGSGFGGDFGSGSSLASEKVKLEGGETKTLDLKTKS